MCKHPLLGVRAIDNSTGAWTVKVLGTDKSFWRKPSDYVGEHAHFIHLPCGKCIECRIAKAREWSIRLMHEKLLHEKSCFLTLTYDDWHLPENESLNKRDVQLFMKSLRKYLDTHFGTKVRYYCAGEYGSKTNRPHYHMILFGEDFVFDRKLWSESHGNKYFRSAALESIWSNGYSIIGDVSPDSVMYVARYVTKKIGGNLSEFWYDGLEPEFSMMSRRPGIGHDFVTKFAGDIYNYDKVIYKQLELRPPKYYDKIYSVLDPIRFCELKDNREINNLSRAFDNDLRFMGDHGYDRELQKQYLADSEQTLIDRYKEKRSLEVL